MRLRFTLGALAAILVLVGCGGGDTTTIIEREVATGEPTGEAAGGEGGSGQEEAAETPSSEAPSEILELDSFQSPSGNIGCLIVDGNARCDISARNWLPPPRPADCPGETDYGQGLQVSSGDGPGSVVCAGDTALNLGAPKLEYGTAASIGAIVCVSRKAGIACTDGPSGHGFFISRDEYRTF